MIKKKQLTGLNRDNLVRITGFNETQHEQTIPDQVACIPGSML